jgi:phosphopantothenoylcysteine decarboxylase/phosphopantothenate--cysteine ligase
MKMIITAGPTREYLDPVRFISNRSTGKMGYALAESAQQRGHTVRLISGPVSLETPSNVDMLPVVTAREMYEEVLASLAWSDVLIMCAAVADWRPKKISKNKCKKDEMSSLLELERTDDILTAVRGLRRPDQYIVGFAAETDQVEAYAREKCQRKGLDLIIANDVSRDDIGFGSDHNAVVMLWPGGQRVSLPVMSKIDVAGKILDYIEQDRSNH